MSPGAGPQALQGYEADVVPAEVWSDSPAGVDLRRLRCRLWRQARATSGGTLVGLKASLQAGVRTAGWLRGACGPELKGAIHRRPAGARDLPRQ